MVFFSLNLGLNLNLNLNTIPYFTYTSAPPWEHTIH